MAKNSTVFVLFIFSLSILRLEARDHKFWSVFDYQDLDQKDKGKPPPSCVLAGLKADLTFEHIFGSLINSTNSKLEELLNDLRVGENETHFKRFLRHARAQNLTCNDPSTWTEAGQRLILSWEPDSTLNFHFRQGKDENGTVHNSLNHVYLKMVIYNSTNEKYTLEAQSQRNLKTMVVPKLFAYVCDIPMNISMNIAIYREDENGTSTKVTETRGQLTLHDVKIELFREKRFYEDITHLKYRCNVGWPYQWVPYALFAFVLFFGMVCTCAFCIRFGPRHIRTESPMVRKRNHATGAQPFDTLKVADIGDVDVCLYDIKKAADRITDYYNGLMSVNCKPLTMGGDHFVSYPILRAIAAKHGPVALIHVDAHADTAEHQSQFDLTHGTPFRRAWEDKLLDNAKVFQIGIRGTGYEKGDTQWGRDQGWRVVRAEECWHKSLDPLMSEIRNTIGQDTPVYLSFDIDSIDPSACPGTGTPEIGGLTTAQALEVVRGCKGLNLVGCDLVEVAPIYDVTGTTAITAANLLYEMLCVMPGVQYIQPDV